MCVLEDGNMNRSGVWVQGEMGRGKDQGVVSINVWGLQAGAHILKK